jgi:hypothetical protein
MRNWSSVLARPEFAALGGLAPLEARTRHEKLNQAETEFGPCPWRQEVTQLGDFLQGISSRVSIAKQPKDQELVASLVRDPRLHDLRMFEAGDKRFYATGLRPLRFQGPDLRITVIRKLPEKQETVTIAEKDITYLDVAPQCKLAARIAEALPADKTESLAKGNWEEVFCDLLAAVRTEPHLEPICAVEIYRRLLRVAIQGSAPMTAVFADDLQAIERHSVDEAVNWLNPDDEEARRERVVASKVLKDLGNLDEQIRKTLQLAKQMSARKFSNFEWRGWLARDEAGAWQVAGAKLGQQAELYVVTIDPEQSTKDRPAGKLSPLGRVDRGRVQWVDDPSVLIEGRPVYVRAGSER